jgi:hypothetical protein
MERVLKNIADPNTKADSVREVNLKIRIKPSKDRSGAATLVQVTSKLAPADPHESFVVFSFDMEPLIFEPRAQPVEVKTLSGFAGFIGADIDGILPCGLIIHVESHREVSLISSLSGELKKRTVYLTAKLDSGLEEFPFGRWLDAEEASIRLLSMFETTEDLQKVVRMTGKTVAQDTLETEDDGFTQRVTVRKGVSGALKEAEAVKSIVHLRPYRTFRELEQVESAFLLRMRPVEGSQPQIALFEADGGAWRNAAVLRIREYLGALKEIADIQIIA